MASIRICGISWLALAVLPLNLMAADADGSVPDPFRGHDQASTFKIQYGDVDAIFRTMVVDVGRSTREKAPELRAKTGTRMKAKVQRQTASEGNRFYFEEFQGNQEFQDMLHNVRQSLEAIPSQVPLESFNRTEQLVYWLNLYNITLLDELVKIYPENDLEKELDGRKSILDQEILNVAGVPLSLNDIQDTILPANYDNNPTVMYGLYQGIIGGPNIRKRAYTGENVYRNLDENARDFINSNRGTFAQNGEFEVSSLYERNGHYFPNFDTDLKAHLLRFIEGSEKSALLAADTLDPDIDDWSITDVYGSYRQIGGSLSDNKAAMMDSIVTFQPKGGSLEVVPTNASFASSTVVTKTPSPSRFSPDVLIHLDVLKEKEEAAARAKEGTVTVEELGEVPATPEDREEKQDSDQE